MVGILKASISRYPKYRHCRLINGELREQERVFGLLPFGYVAYGPDEPSKIREKNRPEMK